MLVLDVELADDVDMVGGWENAKSGAARLACAVTLPLEGTEGLGFWDPHDIEALVDTIEEAPGVLTYNGKGFDLPFLASLVGRPIRPRWHIDLRDVFVQQCGQGAGPWSLAAVATRTLGRTKTEDAASAPGLWRQGRHARVVLYCLNDCLLLRDLFTFVVENRYVVAGSGKEVQVML